MAACRQKRTGRAVTIDETVQKARASLAERLEDSVIEYEDLLMKHGATDDELHREIERYQVNQAAWLDTEMVRLRGWLEAWVSRDNASLH